MKTAAKPDGDAPEVWLPLDVPWELRGYTDAGPPWGVRVSSVVLNEAWFGSKRSRPPTHFRHAHAWVTDVKRLVLRPPLGKAILKAASQLAGLFCNATEIEVAARPASKTDVAAGQPAPFDKGLPRRARRQQCCRGLSLALAAISLPCAHTRLSPVLTRQCHARCWTFRVTPRA